MPSAKTEVAIVGAALKSLVAELPGTLLTLSLISSFIDVATLKDKQAVAVELKRLVFIWFDFFFFNE